MTLAPAPAAEPGELPVVEAFGRWAPTYDAETPLSLLEERLFRSIAPTLRGLRVLDAGCGTARRLPPEGDQGPSLAVGVDLVRAMLSRRRRSHRLVQGDLLSLPLRSGVFDLVWCRLTLGFVDDPEPAFAELGRVTRPGGTVIVTDLHPECAAGGRRTFRDQEGVLWSVAHKAHSLAVQERAAQRAGLALLDRNESAVGPASRDVFDSCGGRELYASLLGRPVVLGLRLGRSSLSPATE